MISNIKQTLDYTLFTYDDREFFPVRYEGQLQNTGEFVRYKLKCLLFKRALV